MFSGREWSARERSITNALASGISNTYTISNHLSNIKFPQGRLRRFAPCSKLDCSAWLLDYAAPADVSYFEPARPRWGTRIGCSSRLCLAGALEIGRSSLLGLAAALEIGHSGTLWRR